MKLLNLIFFKNYFLQNSRLYYENTTGVYYYYDEHSATYKFHSKVDLTTSKQETVCKDDTNGQEEKESGEELSEDEEESDKDVESRWRFTKTCNNVLTMQAETSL